MHDARALVGAAIAITVIIRSTTAFIVVTVHFEIIQRGDHASRCRRQKRTIGCAYLGRQRICAIDGGNGMFARTTPPEIFLA